MPPRAKPSKSSSSRRSKRLSTIPPTDYACTLDDDDISPGPSSAPKVFALPQPANNIFDCEDVIRQVCSHLFRSDLLSMVTVSRSSYYAAVSFLYRHVDLRFPQCRCSSCSNHGKLCDFNSDHIERYTTTLEYFPHPHFHHYDRNPSPPRLETIISNTDLTLLNAVRPRSDYYTSLAVSMYSGIHVCSSCPSPIPSAKRLVLRATHSNFNFVRYSRRDIVIPKTDIPEMVVHINRLMGDAMHSVAADPAFADRPPADAPVSKHITVVVFPFMWDYGPITPKAQRWITKTSMYSFRHALSRIIDSCLWDHDITIVGLEDACPFSTISYWDQRHERGRDFTRGFSPPTRQYRGNHWTTTDAKRRMKGLRFKSFIDYLEGGDWGSELSTILVNRWIEAYRGLEKRQLEEAERKKRGKKRRRSRKVTEVDSEAEDDGDSEYKP